jgi:C1A family cysteine protease
MNKSYLISALLAALALFAIYQHESPAAGLYTFEDYKRDYSKVYSRAGEEQYRKAIFLKNLVKMQKHNADKSNTWEMGVNQFTDLSEAEFTALYLTLKVPQKQTNVKMTAVPQLLNKVGGQIDWVADGKVSLVKNQGACGSCWAFAATGAIESAFLIRDKATELLSEQDLVDCSTGYGNQGCSGGWMESAYLYIEDNGLALDRDYPYTAEDGTCKQVSRPIKLASYQQEEVGSCEQLSRFIQSRPVAVAVDASVWGPYKSGIISECGKAVNHGVLVVGATEDYWKAKNSWSSSWGESGYLRLALGNTCAICQYPSYPILS